MSEPGPGRGKQALVGRNCREHGGEQFFDHCQHIIAVNKGHFQVKLGELRLAVAAQILVAEAARDLEIALDASNLEQLLELLRDCGSA